MRYGSPTIAISVFRDRASPPVFRRRCECRTKFVWDPYGSMKQAGSASTTIRSAASAGQASAAKGSLTPLKNIPSSNSPACAFREARNHDFPSGVACFDDELQAGSSQNIFGRIEV